MGDLRDGETREGGHVNTEAEIGVMLPHPRNNTRNHQKLEEARKDSLLEPLEGVWPGRHLDFGLLALRE